MTAGSTELNADTIKQHVEIAPSNQAAQLLLNDAQILQGNSALQTPSLVKTDMLANAEVALKTPNNQDALKALQIDSKLLQGNVALKSDPAVVATDILVNSEVALKDPANKDAQEALQKDTQLLQNNPAFQKQIRDGLKNLDDNVETTGKLPKLDFIEIFDGGALEASIKLSTKHPMQDDPDSRFLIIPTNGRAETKDYVGNGKWVHPGSEAPVT